MISAKIPSQVLKLLAAGCLIGIAFPRVAVAEVSDDDFNKLKAMVDQLNEKVQRLEQTHEEDQQKIRALEAQSAETAKKATGSAGEQANREMEPQTSETAKKASGSAGEEQKNVVTNPGETGKNVANPPVNTEGTQLPAVSGPLATHDFTLVGDAEFQFAKYHGSHAGFVLADFAPIFLYRASDNVLFEAGFDFIIQNNAPASSGYTTTVNLSFATLDYFYNDYLTIVAGNMLLPLGTYSERSAGWLNKLPDSPLPRAVLPGNGVGLQLRGAIPVGESGQHLTYSAYVVNGPGSVDGTGNADQLDLGGNVGLKSDGTIGNLHGYPSGGGRLGFFAPFKAHYDAEIGVSGQSGEWDNAGNRLWSATVVDAAVHISPYFEAKGEYMNTWVETDDMGTIQPRGWWVQGGYKLAGLNLDVSLPLINLNSIELVGRYDTTNDGLRRHLGTKTNRETVGFVYYLTNTLWFEGDYEWLDSDGPNRLPSHDVIFQLSYGF
jgi:hypothetical protein